MSYSQNNEEEIILDFFKGENSKCFLDVGAWNGVELSNTRQLALNGWNGMAIEPSPIAFLELKKAYEGMDNVDLVNSALDVNPGLKLFYLENNWGSTLHCETRERHSNLKWAGQYLIRTMGIDDLPPWPWDFVSIDAEGVDFDLFNAMFVDNKSQFLLTRLVCVEHANVDKMNWMLTADLAGFKLAHRTPENYLFSR